MSNGVIQVRWRYAGAAIVLLMAMTVILYQSAVAYLTDIWNEISEGEYAHGYLVLAISVYLIFCNRKRLAVVAPCPSYEVFPLILISSFLWLTAVIVNVEMLQSVGLLLVVFTAVWSVVGHRAMSFLAFPILFIGFAIPVWFPLSPPLQDLTADVVFWIVRILEIPAFRQENMIIVPAGILSVEEACSGLRYLLAALTLGSLYAYLNYVTLAARLAVVLVVAATAVLANILRVFIVVYLGYSTDMQHPWVSDHLMLGWYLFGGLVAILLFLDTRFYRHSPASENENVAGLASNNACNKNTKHFYLVAIAGAILISAGPAVVYQNYTQKQKTAAPESLRLPPIVGNWHSLENSENSWAPQYHGAVTAKEDYQRKLESMQPDQVTVFVAYYPWQVQGKEVINDLNRITNKKTWKTKYTRARLKQAMGHEVLEQQIENNHDNQLIWYWYNIGDRVTTNKYKAKVLQLAGVLTGKPQAYVVAVSTVVKDDVETARDQLYDFTAAMKQSLLLPIINENIAE